MENPSRKVIKALVAFISCLSMIGSNHAQNLAFKIPPKNSSAEQRETGKLPLIEILDRIEQYYNVSFAYQKKFLSGKKAVYRVLLNEDLETYLKEILSENQLDFKRIEDITEIIYIVSPLEESKKPGSSSIISDSSQVLTADEKPRKYKVYGTVKGTREEIPVPGVNVLLKGTAEGTTTDSNGNFSLDVPHDSDNILIFSYVGCTTLELPLTKTNRVDVVLTEDVRSLSEVIVTALGISRPQKTLGYAVSSIGSDELTSSGSLNVTSALYGKPPGVRIRTAPGGATSAVTVQVRGLNSLNYSTQPLYVIDGVVMRDGNEKGAAGINNEDYFKDTRIRGNGILDINPTDIETLTVLKGASATALYGSDASSGVILLTTKKGAKRDGLGVDINYQITQEEVAFTPRYQNIYGPGFDRKRNVASGASEEGWVSIDADGDGVVEGKRPLFESYAQFGPTMEGQEVIWWDGSVRKFSPQPDNYKNFYRKGYGSVFNVALVNEIDKWSYRFSVTRGDYAGIQVGGKLARNTINLNTSLKLTDQLNMDLMVNYTNSFVHNRPLKINRLMSSWNGFFSRAENMSLFFNKYKTSAGYKWVPYDQSQRDPEEALKFTTPQGYEVMNILWQQLTNSEDESQDRVISSFTVNYEILKNLKLRGRVGNDFTSTSIETLQHNEYPTEFNGTSSTGSYGSANGRYTLLYTDALLTYTQNFPRGIKFAMNGGFQLRDEKYHSESITTSGGLVQENWFSLSNSYNPTLTTVQSNSKILKYAFLGILNLSYKDYLFLEGTGRQEYSSTLPPGDNSYFYPSVNTGFVFSEAFKMPAFLNYGKLRASYGVVGNAPPAYESNILYNLTNLQTTTGSVISAEANGSLFGNNSIRPERKHEMEFGLDARIFHNKIGVDFSYYRSRTFNQILKLDIPSSTGSDRLLANVGTLESHGWELGLNATPFAKGITWNTGVSAAMNTTTLQSLSSGVDRLILRDFEGNSIHVVAERGQPVGNIYVYPRMTDDAGNFIINDAGLYVIDHSKYVKAGNLLPKFTGGFMNSILYKNFNLQINFDYSFGGQIISPALKYGLGAGLYENTLQYRDAAHGGLPYYINAAGNKILLPKENLSSPDNSQVFHDGVLLKGVKEDGIANTTVIDAATYYINTFTWGNNAWNEEGAIYDNSYIKLREVVLGYTIPKTVADKLHFQSIRVSLIGRNLFYVWRTLKNLDPESTIGTNWLNQGIDEGAGAATRSYGFTVNMSF
ncbi:MAG TPA: SusC/RagA family TonB-linked outer membrane protein [Chryseolinea sp.]|nr:SusC/RagA family TonB-linked outer membrane protein [Chryseolinea sp.]